jgi:hypothetical protein
VTITINKSTLIFVLGLVVLAALGYFVGTQVMGPPGQAGPVQVTATLPAGAEALSSLGQSQLEMPTQVPDTAPRIEVDAFKQQLDQKLDMVIVDVRTPEQFAEGHIAGAINIPEAETEQRLAELPKDKQIVLYCA